MSTAITAAPPAVAVRCRGVTKEFGQGESKTKALTGVDLDVFAGEMTLLVGPSGCGKTTLLSIIAGLLEPTRGHRRCPGPAPHGHARRPQGEVPRRQHRFVFQQYNCCRR